MNRREFSRSITAVAGSALLPAIQAAARNLKVGYTCITWGAFPRGAEANATLEAAVKDISALGFYSFETFPEILDDWDARGALSKLIEQYHLPLKSGYCRTNLTDASKRKESVEQVIKLGKTIAYRVQLVPVALISGPVRNFLGCGNPLADQIGKLEV